MLWLHHIWKSFLINDPNNRNILIKKQYESKSSSQTVSFCLRISFHNNLKVLAGVSVQSGWLRLSLGRSLGEAMLEETHDVIIHPSLLEERDKNIFWCSDISADSVHSVTLVLITTQLKMGVGCFWIQSREFVFCLIWEPFVLFLCHQLCLCVIRREAGWWSCWCDYIVHTDT